MNEARPYQRAAFEATMQGWATARRQLIVMPTGTGKTVVFALIAEASRPTGRILVLAHREELLDQARAKIAAWTSLSTGLEQGPVYADDRADVVVASIQTLARTKRLERFKPNDFSLVVVDEAHHAPAETYQRVVNYFDARLLGVTATPDRLDRRSLDGTFDAVPFVYELREAITDGWLVPIRQRIAYLDKLNLDRVRTMAGDLNEGDLEMAVIGHGLPNAVARATAEAAGTRPTLVFAVTIAHAEILATALGQYADPDRILVLSGRSSDQERRSGLERFRRGEVQFLVNVSLFTEGFDEASISCVSVARPTKSRLLYAQMVGRGTRTLPGKRDLLVVDFAGNAGRHTLINCFNILGGDDPELCRRAESAARDRPDGCDVLEELEAQQAIEADRLRREALEAAKRAETTKVRYVEVDPFRQVYSILNIRPISGRMGGIEPTPEQLEQLRLHKVDKDMPLRNLDRGQAAEILARITERPKRGFCTYKMARVLVKFGYDPDVPFPKAKDIITRLEAHNWTRVDP